MTPHEVLAAEDAFFQALVKADATVLDSILTGDFLIIDVMRGDVTGRSGFLAAAGSQQIAFHQIDPAERQVRFHGTTAIVTGRTQMSGASSDGEFTIASRYTHVFVHDTGGWKLASAQGTPITG